MAEADVRELGLPFDFPIGFCERDQPRIRGFGHGTKQDDCISIKDRAAADRHVERVWLYLVTPGDFSVEVERGHD